MKIIKLGRIGIALLSLSAPSVWAQILPGPIITDWGEIWTPPPVEEGRRYRLAVGDDLGYDDNPFRLPSGTSASSVGARSNTNDTLVNRLYGQANIDLPVSRQRFLAQLTANSFNYSKLSYLNYNSMVFRGRWDWQVGDLWSGNLGYDHLNSLADFIDVRPIFKDIRTYDSGYGSAELAVTPHWHPTLDLIQYRAGNSDSRLADTDSTQATGQFGIKYLATGANYVEAYGSYGRGSYPYRDLTKGFDNRYDQTEVGLDSRYSLSEATFVLGRIGYTHRDYPHVSGRNFSGVTGRAEFDWGISPKTGINFLFRSALDPFDDTSGSYMHTTVVGLTPYWNIGPKLRLEASYEHWRRSFSGNALVPAANERRDNLDFGRIALSWTPTRHWLMRFGYVYSRRGSTDSTQDFDDNVVFGTLEFNI